MRSLGVVNTGAAVVGLSLLVSACSSKSSTPSAPTNISTPSASASPSATATASASPSAAGSEASSAFPTFTFVDGLHGWFAQGENIWASQDAGHYWMPVATVSGVVTGLSFSSVNLGWAATLDGLQQTDDGGRTWRPIATGAYGHPTWVQFVDQRHGWITILGGLRAGGIYEFALRSTADGGQSWRDVALPCSPPPGLGTYFSFVTHDTGFALCAGQPGAGAQAKWLYRTLDGGQTWQLIESVGVPGGGSTPYPSRWLPQGGYAQNLFFIDKTHGWISLSRAGVAATKDGGISWDSLGFPYAEPFPQGGVVFASDSQGWVVMYPSGEGGQSGDVPSLLETVDGGRTWSLLCADVRSCN